MFLIVCSLVLPILLFYLLIKNVKKDSDLQRKKIELLQAQIDSLKEGND